jgi:6-phosphogluconolactonase
MIVVVIGVAGSGKTTVGTMLADAMKCPFLEGDSLHPKENIDKMSHGIPLTDSDRDPWLLAIHARILDSFERGQDLVVGCSALKQAYRRVLGKGIPVSWVYLKGSPALLRSRLTHRPSHFMKVDMLASQFEALEEPSDALVVDVSAPPSAIVERILSQLPIPVRQASQGRLARGSSVSDQKTKRDLRVFPDVKELSLRAAQAAVRTINNSVRTRGRCSLALSGGNTPRTLYTLLASEFRDQIPWAQTHVFWGDERYVSPDDPESNYRMAKETLLDHVPCPAGNVHPMPTYFPSADAAARDYERTLRNYFRTDWPRFDLNLLGLGDDAHTASLFPGSPALEEPTRWVVAVETPADPPLRLTLTLRALTRAANIYVLVAGSRKANALHHVLTGSPDPNTFPAAGVRLAEGRLIWWVDRAAAEEHESTRRVRSQGDRSCRSHGR